MVDRNNPAFPVYRTKVSARAALETKLKYDNEKGIIAGIAERDSAIIDVTDRLVDFSEYTKEELKRTYPQTYFSGSSDELQRIKEEIKFPAPHEFQVILKTKKGKEKSVKIKTYPIFFDFMRQKPMHVYTYFRIFLPEEETS